MSNPMVSIITIFLNAGSFIEEAIASVRAQTFADWELILVDDGSTDQSTAIAQQYASLHPEQIRYYKHERHQNRGMSASRNLGICMSHGEYIAFLDADDVWLPQNLERQVALLQAQPSAAMVYSSTQWWYSWTGRPEDQSRDFMHDLGVPADTLLQPPRLLATFLQHPGSSPCTCSVLLRRSAVEQVGIFEERFRGMYEDQIFFAKLCLNLPVYVSSGGWARYRQHPASNCATTERAGQESAVRLTFLNWLAGYLAHNSVTDRSLWRVLQAELRRARHPLPQLLIQRVRNSPLGQLYRAGRSIGMRWRSLPVIRHTRALQLRRLSPLGNGRLRGTPIVRYYWASFLQQHQRDFHGRALEIGTTTTIRQYGGAELTHAEAIDLQAHSPEVNVVADLSRADHVAADSYDCFVNQFSMHLIYDVEAALYHSVRLLKPGGVLLVNFPCVDYNFSRGLDMGTGSPLYLYWWFTPIQVENLLRRVGLGTADYSITLYGNLFARVAYQMNMPAEELTRRELKHIDAGHPLLICVRVVKPQEWSVAQPEYRDPWLPDTVPAKWNSVTGHYAA
jgi:glycosyltransferase involved in cell wall biosynthesis